MAQDFGFTGVLGKQAHSGLRNFFLARLWSQKTSQTRVLLNSRSLVISYTVAWCKILRIALIKLK